MKSNNCYKKKPFAWMMHLIHPMNALHIITFLSFIFLSGFSTAQNPEWFPTGSTYTYAHQNIDGPDYYQTSLEISEQTTINGQPCGKMELMENESTYLFFCMVKSPPFYLFEQNDSVFYATDDDPTFRLLYNFNAGVGDVWYVVVDHSFGFDSLEVEVLENELVNVDGFDLKQLTVSITTAPSEDDIFIEPPFGPVRILEYVGALDFFFIIIGKNPSCDATTSEALQCYSSESLNYVSDLFNSCTLTSTSSESNRGTLRFYPNPATDRLSISFPENSPAHFELRLYDLSGRLVHAELNYKADQMINLRGFSPGVYILQANTSEGSFSGKLVVE